ncbi:unnamed protein product, partial [marine sediment metagenome]
IEKMTRDAAENKDELSKYLNTPQAQQSIGQLLITQKTVQRLVEIAEGSDTSVEAKQKEGQE